MRVALIIPANVFMAPYLRYYTKVLERNDINFDIISWNRLNVKEPGYITYNVKSEDSKYYLEKIYDYYRFLRFVKSKVLEGKYDKVIVFTILIGILLHPFLKKLYRHNFIFDIRDYSPALLIFKGRFEKLIRNSAFTVISSPGFYEWLPKGYTYVVGHNCSVEEKSHFELKSKKVQNQEKFEIVTIGGIRDFSANRDLIKSLANDEKFMLKFIGSGFAKPLLLDFVARENITNVEFEGKYEKCEEPDLIKGASFINILTENDLKGKTLMSNRFYLALLHKLPIIVNEDSVQGQFAKDFKLGVRFRKGEDLKTSIWEFNKAFDFTEFSSNCDKLLTIIKKDQHLFEKNLEAWLGESPIKK